MNLKSRKVPISNRVVAKLIDLFFVMLCGALLPRFVGPLIGFAYSITADGFKLYIPGMRRRGFLRGQSIGKKLMRLQVRNFKTGHFCSLRESMIRNAPVGVATFFAIIPVWGWLILPLVGLPLMLFEIYLMLKVETGRRLGDVMADTEVMPEFRSKRPDRGVIVTKGSGLGEDEPAFD